MPYTGATEGPSEAGHAEHSWRLLCIASFFSVLLGAGLACAAEPYDPWPGLVQDVFGNRPMRDGAG